jgi:hypothetical protein
MLDRGGLATFTAVLQTFSVHESRDVSLYGYPDEHQAHVYMIGSKGSGREPE